MPFELKLAWKYFRARRKSLARFTALAAIIGIAAGVASLILAQSLARGFADEMREKILANTPHIAVSMRDGGEIFNWKDVRDELAKEENVEEILPTVLENAVFAGKDSANYALLRVAKDGSGPRIEKGADPKLAPDSPDVIEADQIQVRIGAGLAAKTGIKTGDSAEIVTFENDSTKRSKVRVAEIFETGLYEYDSTWITLSPEDHVKLTGGLRFTPTVLTVSVKDIYKADKTSYIIREKLGDNFKIIDWQEANQPLFGALSLERKVSLAIISLIIFVAALNITTTLSLLVNERKLDIAVLRTCGATPKQLLGAFLAEGLLLGCIGILLGLIAGISGCALGNYFKFVSLPAEVYSLTYVPFHIDLVNIFLIISIAILLCLASAIYPAFKASRVKPLENLRTR